MDNNKAKTLLNTIAAADAVQARMERGGAKVILCVVNGNEDIILVKVDRLEEILGSEYNSICADAMDNLKIALAKTKSNAKADLELEATEMIND